MRLLDFCLFSINRLVCRYFVITSKHHEGYTLFPSVTSFNWNSVDVGAHRDLIAELEKSIRASGLHFGVYFSQMDW